MTELLWNNNPANFSARTICLYVRTGVSIAAVRSAHKPFLISVRTAIEYSAMNGCYNERLIYVQVCSTCPTLRPTNWKKCAPNKWKGPIHTVEQQHREPEQRNEKLAGVKFDQKSGRVIYKRFKYNYGDLCNWVFLTASPNICHSDCSRPMKSFSHHIPANSP